MVIAGDRDDVVPAALSKKLYEAAAEPKRYVLIPGAGHNDQELLDGHQMIGDVLKFLEEHRYSAGDEVPVEDRRAVAILNG